MAAAAAGPPEAHRLRGPWVGRLRPPLPHSHREEGCEVETFHDQVGYRPWEPAAIPAFQIRATTPVPSKVASADGPTAWTRRNPVTRLASNVTGWPMSAGMPEYIMSP